MMTNLSKRWNNMNSRILAYGLFVHGYHAYMEQREAAVNTTLYFERQLGERDFNE